MSTRFIGCAGPGVLPSELSSADCGPMAVASWTGRRTEQPWQLPIGGTANSELYLLDLASGRRRDLIAPDKINVTRPRFSPDGKWIAYSTEATLNSDDIFVVPASGGQPRRITQAPWYLKGFAWSIDGESLTAVASRRSNKLQMWQFSLDGGAPHPAGELDADRGSEPTLSRRKGSLAWVRDLSVNSLWRMSADESGRPPEHLANSAAVDVDAEWSSNGRMVFRSNRSGARRTVDSQGRRSRPMAGDVVPRNICGRSPLVARRPRACIHDPRRRQPGYLRDAVRPERRLRQAAPTDAIAG